MTDEQINQRIAEACGWKGNLICRDMEGNLWPSEPPNYCDDLNAMHEAEKTLMQNGNWRMGEYEARLFNSAEEVNNVSLYFHATARQRAEAFLRTLGKWEEVQK